MNAAGSFSRGYRTQALLRKQGFELRRLATQILIGRLDLPAEFGGGVPRPARGVEDGASESDKVCITGRNDCFGLRRLGDQADGYDRHFDGAFDCPCERYLVARADRDRLRGMQTTARYVDGIAASCFEHPGKFDA